MGGQKPIGSTGFADSVVQIYRINGAVHEICLRLLLAGLYLYE